jgi:dTDP-4-dehydrorhamnose reductase
MDRMKKINVLILGATGMLGSMMYDYFSQNKKFNVKCTARQKTNLPYFDSNLFLFDANENFSEQLREITHEFCPDYVINCIGIINKYCRDDDNSGVQTAIKVNALFPHILTHLLSSLCPDTRIIQIATDCVFSGRKGDYDENDIPDPIDIYGKTKNLGEVIAPNILNIRCSIIGPEVFRKASLLEWFLSQSPNASLTGYDHHLWNGVTTLQFAQFCERIISKDLFNKFNQYGKTIHYCINETVTKYQLLKIFSAVFEKEVELEYLYDEFSVMNRSLSSVLLIEEKVKMIQAVTDLREYIFSRILWSENYR